MHRRAIRAGYWPRTALKEAYHIGNIKARERTRAVDVTGYVPGITAAGRTFTNISWRRAALEEANTISHVQPREGTGAIGVAHYIGAASRWLINYEVEVR